MLGEPWRAWTPASLCGPDDRRKGRRDKLRHDRGRAKRPPGPWRADVPPPRSSASDNWPYVCGA